MLSQKQNAVIHFSSTKRLRQSEMNNDAAIHQNLTHSLFVILHCLTSRSRVWAWHSSLSAASQSICQDETPAFYRTKQ